MFIQETRTKDRVPRSIKNIHQFFKEQNGILAGIVKACRQIPEPLEEVVEEEEQEVVEEEEQEVPDHDYDIEDIEESEESDDSIEEIDESD